MPVRRCGRTPASVQVKNVQRVLLGKYEVETWYFSPYPDDYSKLDKVGLA